MRHLLSIAASLLIMILQTVAVTSCDKAADEPLPPGKLPDAGNQDATGSGTGPLADTVMEQFLQSAVVRCQWTDTLSSDSIGIMTINRADGTLEFHNVDTGRSLTFAYRSVNPDSTLADATLTIDATAVDIASSRLLKATATTAWHHLTATDSTRILICAPAR